MTDGQPASVWWDDATQTLFIADDDNNQIWTWTDATGLSKAATTPDSNGELDAGATLVGQIVRLGDGTIVVARFGSPKGSYGGVAFVRPDGGRAWCQGFDPSEKHLGLGLAPDGRPLWKLLRWNRRRRDARAVTTVDLVDGEMDYASGFARSWACSSPMVRS